jgi:hypothetical protein
MIGLFLVMSINTVIDVWSSVSIYKDKFDADGNFDLKPDLTTNPKILSALYIQILGCYIFVVSKRTVDYFAIFNKRPDAQFSIFQYAKYTETDKKIKIQQNR